jgi:polygalacturonase
MAVVLCLGWLSPGLAQTPPYFNVKNYGATGDGTTLDSPFVNSAILAASAAGGGTVTFPSGNYLCGSIHLTNNITLYLSNSAVILASATNIDTHESNPYSQYQDEGHSYFHDSLIWGENLTNLTFAGPGEINGNGALTTGDPSAVNPGDKALCLVSCSNVVITGITITRGGHFGILADACTNMLVSGAQILESTSRDGFNLIDSSSVIVTNCVIQGSDDSMCLKSDYALGRRIGGQNIHIVNCQILSTQNNALQFGSETVGDFHDVTWENIQIGGAGKAGIGITSQDGSVIDGVTYDNITMSNCACPIFLKLDYRTTDTPNPSVGRIQNISINNVTATHSTSDGRTNTSTINGYFDTNTLAVVPIQNITFQNINVSNIGQNPAYAVTNYPVENQDWQPQNFGNWPCYGWYLRYARNISFTNCQAHFDHNDDRPAVITDTVTNVLFENFTADIGGNDTNYDMGFLRTANFDVTNAVASANAPSPGEALRTFASNAAPALIVSPPYFSPGDGIYTGTQMVVIASGTPGAAIHYTTDGTTPGSTSGLTYSGPVAIDGETVLRAIASASGFVDSAVNTATCEYPGTSLVLPPPPPATNFAFEAVSLGYVTNGATASVQSDSNEPGGEWLALLATGVGQYIQYTIPAIPAGTYDLQMPYKPHNNRGILSLALDGTVLGNPLDQYQSGSVTQTYPTQDWGNVTFITTTSHTIRLVVTGKNTASSGYELSAAEFVFGLVQPPQPVFTGTSGFQTGGMQLAASGYPTLPYRVQLSTNLAASNWVTIGTATAATDGTLNFSDQTTTNDAQRFYRLVWP